ncbi:MAG: SDR family NAD(P)-dependent oxidoreductase [Myxococcota bacterium]|nr:SDR family NAD(P)-dependent oxidoreductase [Myxococcota bacterium]
MQDLRDRVAVVTGAASGIGRGMARALVEEGAKVVLADVEAAPLEETAAEMRASGGDVQPVCCDVSDAAAMDHLRDETLNAFGAVHVLCNNAGVGGGGTLPIWEQPASEWNWVMGVNLDAVIHGIQRFMPLMIEQGAGGHVVNTASIAGLILGGGIYGVSKHAVVALSEAIYRDTLSRGLPIGVSVLCPGWVNTRILESERNRPESPRDTPEEPDLLNAEIRKMVEMSIQNGMDPDAVGRRVVSAIHQEQFYILTHDWTAMVENRMRPILEGRNPEMMMPPLGGADESTTS